MKNNSILYMAPKKGMEYLKKVTQTMPGEIVFISPCFVRGLTDEQFREFCAMKTDFKVNEKSTRIIQQRMEQLGIKYDIDFNTNTLKTV